MPVIATQKLFDQKKDSPTPKDKGLYDPIYPENKFTLTLEETKVGLYHTGKWDAGYKSEQLLTKAESPNAKDILELKVIGLPETTITGSNRYWSVESSKLHVLFSSINIGKSKLRVLDLSDYEFDDLSLSIIFNSLQEFCDPKKHPTLQILKLNYNQNQLHKKEYQEYFEQLRTTYHIEIELIKPQLTHKLKAPSK